jgi:hypothetical protein
MKTCSICENRYYAKGFCKKHYTRWHVHGDPNVQLTWTRQQVGQFCVICGNPVWGRGLCSLHWKRWRRHGDPTKTVHAPSGTPLAFLERALTYKSNDCLPWPYGQQTNGYGAVTGRTASSMICEMAHGPAPEGQPEAMHSCHNKICVNPNHLTWANHAENMASGNKHSIPKYQPKTEPVS